MSENSFYTRTASGFASTAYTRGPWDDRFQHGGPPSALLLHEMWQAVREQGDRPFAPARLTTEFLRPVPLGPLQVHLEPPTTGRTVRRCRATLVGGGKTVMEASAVFVRQDPAVQAEHLVRPGPAAPTWPDPKSLPQFVFPFFRNDVGYHRAVDLRLVDTPWSSTPVRCWAKTVVDLLEGEPIVPEEMAVVLADAESGIGPPTDPLKTTYLNPDLTVYFTRRPAPGFVGLDIVSHVGDAGVGLSEAGLRDAHGVFGRSAQALLLQDRDPG